jgi:hypothetical protein
MSFFSNNSEIHCRSSSPRSIHEKAWKLLWASSTDTSCCFVYAARAAVVPNSTAWTLKPCAVLFFAMASCSRCTWPTVYAAGAAAAPTATTSLCVSDMLVEGAQLRCGVLTGARRCGEMRYLGHDGANTPLTIVPCT